MNTAIPPTPSAKKNLLIARVIQLNTAIIHPTPPATKAANWEGDSIEHSYTSHPFCEKKLLIGRVTKLNTAIPPTPSAKKAVDWEGESIEHSYTSHPFCEKSWALRTAASFGCPLRGSRFGSPQRPAVALVFPRSFSSDKGRSHIPSEVRSTKISIVPLKGGSRKETCPLSNKQMVFRPNSFCQLPDCWREGIIHKPESRKLPSS